MNEHLIALLKQAKLEKRLFFYSWSPHKQPHNYIEVCTDCDAILIDEKYRTEVENNLL